MRSRKMAAHQTRWRMAMWVRVFLLFALAPSQYASAEPQHDMLLFLSAESLEIFSASEPDLEGNEFHAAADFLYTYNNDRFRFLAEYIWSNSEAEMERFKAAWVVDDDTILWFGRFHTISNFWTSEYHHGKYMQTSISRPGLEEWEDESGPMPSHITGAWLEHRLSLRDQSALSVSIAGGMAPKFEGQQLSAFDVLDPASGHDLAVTGRMVYRPDVLSESQIGLTVSHSDIAVVPDSNPALIDLNSVQQSTVGVFTNWQSDEWRVSSNLVYFDVDMHYGSGVINDEFLLGYVQAEYEVSEAWTVFGRTEFGMGEDDSRYLSLLPAVVAHRQMLGARWDFADQHALTFEIADTSRQADTLQHDHFKEARLQWSSVFP